MSELTQPRAHTSDGGGAIDFGRIGVWHPTPVAPQLARRIEALGYRTLWVGFSPAADLVDVERLLEATDRLVVATGVVNVWESPAEEVAKSYRRLAVRHAGRFVLGIGAGHPEVTAQFDRPLEALRAYLDALECGGVPAKRVVLAALGPKMLRLARDRTAGAHPYLTTPHHTQLAREVLGPHCLLAPEQKVVLEVDHARARDLGNSTLRFYLGLRNYTRNLRRFGFGDDDLTGDGSDQLFDALIANGTADAVVAGVSAHLAAGADHVAVQAIGVKDPLPTYRALAAALSL